MSAPDTNIERQKKRHKPAIWGLWGGLFLAVILIAIFVWLMSGDEVAAAVQALHLMV
ncbi:hypothetical protein [uncultured Roseobacter sp.]|uniref:hypothetical protein n=1 Tax=uncultured Roseobacter sp. TaxID=114847 RepID=UPI00262F6756|nr:hypothetical protein [uncultured Roseobacter sp.]